jgi:poly-gamma-glutamate synthesis protein (capsule biosynthesis protein)
MKKILCLLIFHIILSACQPATLSPVQPVAQPATQAEAGYTPTPYLDASATPTIPTETMWLDPASPDALRMVVLENNVTLVDDPALAASRLSVGNGDIQWVYALVVPFPTVRDEVSVNELRATWSGTYTESFSGSPLFMAESTQKAIAAIWGEADPGSVVTVDGDSVTDALWMNRPSWGIVPFESLDPKLKVLAIDGRSPIYRDFDLFTYPLTISFGLEPINMVLPATNRDPLRFSTLMLTGVTALVRATAVKMEKKGVLYPAEDIGDLLRDADITHISNEIPFAENCPYPDASQVELRFCSDMKYIQLLDYIDADIIELTGNHFQDYGSQATLDTIAMYNERDWPYYGGGVDLADSKKPAFIEHNGNRFAFIGCNPVGPEFAWAREDRPGAAPCAGYDFDWLIEEITRLRSEGYIVIATFQYYEYYKSEPTPRHMEDFRSIAEAGATIVSGSQAHFPQGMEFYADSTFIHYGLGNLFFDQMDIPGWGTRREFIDRHVFYDGKHISTELFSAMLEDFARPRLMTSGERQTFLQTLFTASGW